MHLILVMEATAADRGAECRIHLVVADDQYQTLLKTSPVDIGRLLLELQEQVKVCRQTMQARGWTEFKPRPSRHAAGSEALSGDV